MPLIFLAAGLFLLIAGVRGGDNMQKAIDLLKGDFIGDNSFINWLAALFALGSIGYIKPARPVSVALMVLVMVVLLLSNGGFFKRFQEQIQS